MISSPFDFFDQCFAEAKRRALPQHDAMALITATASATPSARMVLLKGVQNETFRFFTNYGSRKASELAENPRAQLLFYWPGLGRQIRVEGTVERTNAADSDAYWYSRRRESRIGAIASHQSQELASLDDLRARVAEVEAKYEGREVPRPEFWGGFSLTPSRFEFWEDGEFRLHERIIYERADSGWVTHRLNP